MDVNIFKWSTFKSKIQTCTYIVNIFVNTVLLILNI